MKRLSSLVGAFLALIVLIFSSPAWAYDSEMAASYAELFAPAHGAAVGKKMHFMSPEAFVKAVKSKKQMVVVDVRTPAERDILGSTLPGTMNIPIHELFKTANLKSIPTDKAVVMMCKSGARATAAGTALRHVGFENVVILKGGFKGLITYLGAKEANMPLKVKTAMK